MHPPTLEDDFMDCGDIELRECANDTIKALEKEIWKNPEASETFRRLSVCYRAMGTPESRLLSMQAIERALELDPENPSYHVEKGLTLYARQFTGSAMESLDKAIELDPGCFQAWYHKGRIEKDLYLKNMCSEKHLDNAIRYFTKADNIRGDHEETLFDLGLLQYLRERLDVCIRCARTGEAHYPESYRFRLLSSCVALERNSFDTASAGFDSALVLMDLDTRYMYEDVYLLLPMDERGTYLNLDERNRAEFNRKFWIMNDPTPATILNGRKLEHYRRIFLSTELLTNRRLGLEGVMTARDRALVSYGLPPRLLLKMGSGTDGPFVVWTYLQGDKMFMLYFQDEFLNGNYHIPIDPRFYDYAMITEGILQSVQQMYDYPVEYRHIPVGIEYVQFRASMDNTRVDFAVALPDSLLDPGDGSYSLDFTLFDHDWKVFLSERRSFDPDTLTRFEKSSVYWRVFPFTMELPPLQLESSFAVEITGGKPPGRAVYRSPLTIRDLSGSHLSLSGLRFSLRDEKGACMDLLDPFPSYAPGSSLCVSYEIYNLKRNTENIARYRMTWSVTSSDASEGPSGTWDWITASVRGSRPARIYISSSIDQVTSERSTSDFIMLEASSLEPGRYLLILEIEDLEAGFRVSGERPFSITTRTGS
jgi:GWxTD domain-containing protein